MLEDGLAGAIAFLIVYGVYLLANKVEKNTEKSQVTWHVYTALKSSLFGAVVSLMIMPFFLALLSATGLLGDISAESIGPYLIGGFFICTAWFYRKEYVDEENRYGSDPLQSTGTQEENVSARPDREERISSARAEQKAEPSGTQEFDPDEHEKKCPMCAEYIKLEARVCRYCGHEFSEEEVLNQIEEGNQEYESSNDKIDLVGLFLVALILVLLGLSLLGTA